MADLAKIPDVEESWRSLRGNEPVVALSELGAASAEIRLKRPGIDARIAAEAALGGLTPLGVTTRKVVARAVRRYLRARDPADPSQYGGPLITADDLALLDAAVGTVNRSSGSFRLGNPYVPATCVTPTYPMF